MTLFIASQHHASIFSKNTISSYASLTKIERPNLESLHTTHSSFLRQIRL
jgi:hypothetical protein